MTMLLVLLFPALAFAMVGFFIYQWKKGVSNGTFQKGQFSDTVFNRKKQLTMGVGAIFKYLHGARCVNCNEHIEQNPATSAWMHHTMSPYCKDGNTTAEPRQENND